MPYIKSDRESWRRTPIGEATPATVGELNFLFTSLAWQYFQLNGKDYQSVNDVLGALEGAKLEFYRRVAAPYEDKKIEENGDVYV